jgi:hypothetical protein
LEGAKAALICRSTLFAFTALTRPLLFRRPCDLLSCSCRDAKFQKVFPVLHIKQASRSRVSRRGGSESELSRKQIIQITNSIRFVNFSSLSPVCFECLPFGGKKFNLVARWSPRSLSFTSNFNLRRKKGFSLPLPLASFFRFN